MELFNFLKQKSDNRQFDSEKSFNNKLASQKQNTPQRLDQLRKLNVTDDQHLKLEYFFYTNTLEKAGQLEAWMKKFSYTAKCGVSEGDKNLFIITGWTTKMKMSDEIVRNWIKKMNEIGEQFDCDFDGWGTNSDQDETN